VTNSRTRRRAIDKLACSSVILDKMSANEQQNSTFAIGLIADENNKDIKDL